MLRIAAVAVVLALLPAAGAAQPVVLHLVADGEELRLADEPAAAVVPLVADGDRDPLLVWQSAPFDHAYLEGYANVTLYLEGAGGPRYASLLAGDGNASRVLASGQFGQSGILPSHDHISLDVSGQQIHAGERLSLILRVADPVGAVLLTGPATPSHVTLPLVDAPVDAPEAGSEGAAGADGGGGSGGAWQGDPASGDGTALERTEPAAFDPSSLAQPVVAWILAVGVAAVSLGLAARVTGGAYAWWLLGGFTVQTAAQAVLLWLRPARVVDEPLRRRRRPARPTVRQRTPMEKILAEASPARVDPLESGPRPTRRRDETPRGGPHSAAEPGSIHRVGATPGAKGAASASAGLGRPEAPAVERPGPRDPSAGLCGAPTPHGPCKQRTAPDEPWCAEHGGQSQRKKRGPWG